MSCLTSCILFAYRIPTPRDAGVSEMHCSLSIVNC